jgi:hypothetical protein
MAQVAQPWAWGGGTGPAKLRVREPGRKPMPRRGPRGRPARAGAQKDYGCFPGELSITVLGHRMHPVNLKGKSLCHRWGRHLGGRLRPHARDPQRRQRRNRGSVPLGIRTRVPEAGPLGGSQPGRQHCGHPGKGHLGCRQHLPRMTQDQAMGVRAGDPDVLPREHARDPRLAPSQRGTRQHQESKRDGRDADQPASRAAPPSARPRRPRPRRTGLWSFCRSCVP